jgi:hypothetical protein
VSLALRSEESRRKDTVGSGKWIEEERIEDREKCSEE